MQENHLYFNCKYSNIITNNKNITNNKKGMFVDWQENIDIATFYFHP